MRSLHVPELMLSALTSLARGQSRRELLALPRLVCSPLDPQTSGHSCRRVTVVGFRRRRSSNGRVQSSRLEVSFTHHVCAWKIVPVQSHKSCLDPRSWKACAIPCGGTTCPSSWECVRFLGVKKRRTSLEQRHASRETLDSHASSWHRDESLHRLCASRSADWCLGSRSMQTQLCGSSDFGHLREIWALSNGETFKHGSVRCLYNWRKSVFQNKRASALLVCVSLHLLLVTVYFQLTLRSRSAAPLAQLSPGWSTMEPTLFISSWNGDESQTSAEEFALLFVCSFTPITFQSPIFHCWANPRRPWLPEDHTSVYRSGCQIQLSFGLFTHSTHKLTTQNTECVVTWVCPNLASIWGSDMKDADVRRA